MAARSRSVVSRDCSRLSTKNRRRRNSTEIAGVSNNHADHIGRSESAPQAAANCHPVPPTSADGIEKYLSSGVIRGVGPVYAKKLVRAFGEKVFDVIETMPGRLREVDGIGPVRAASILSAWAEQKVVREGNSVGTDAPSLDLIGRSWR